jgi:hypothetical protein
MLLKCRNKSYDTQYPTRSSFVDFSLLVVPGPEAPTTDFDLQHAQKAPRKLLFAIALVAVDPELFSLSLRRTQLLLAKFSSSKSCLSSPQTSSLIR